MNRNSFVAGRALATLALTLGLFGASAAFAATYYVDNQHPSANDSGPGTESTPYRTISAAVTQRGGAGNQVLVKTGTYREQVTVGASGAPGNPFVIAAQGLVTLEGAEDYTSAARWTLVSGSTWRASSVTWEPNQVFVGGRRLVKSTMNTLPTGTFRWVLGTGLLVNVSGGNPGNQGTLVGRHNYGFRLPGRSWVTIRGFQIVRADEKGIYALDGSNNVVIERNRVSRSASSGIHVVGSSGAQILDCEAAANGDHGIQLSLNATGALLRGNSSHHNQRVDRDGANGFHLFSAPGNRLENNQAYENQDSGFQFNSGSNQVVSVLNRSWNNDDHGFDHLGSTGVSHVHDVASGNAHDGFSFEGSSPGGRVHNSIGVNNGIGSSNFDLWVDASSQAGFASDYNIFWNSNGQAPVRWGATPYTQVSAFASATGQDRHSRQADPMFVNAAGGDFHLLATSPAIDAANSGVENWPPLDADGRARFDVLAVSNSAGAGPVPYADRGAFEFAGGVVVGTPPVAALSVSPSSGAAPLKVTANASASTDADGEIETYRFDFGDGATAGPQSSPTATHTYAPGTWTLRVTVTDDDGLTDTESRTVTVSGGAADRAPVVTAPSRVTVDEERRLTIQVTAKDPDGQPIHELTADLSDLPKGHNARFKVVDGDTAGTLTWTPTYEDSGSHRVTFRARNALTGTATTTIQVRNVDRAPIVSAPSEIKTSPGALVKFTVTARDPDGDAIRSLTVDLDRASGATFVVNETNTRGTFTWTPTKSALKNGKVGNFHPRFVARNALTGTDVTHIQVKAVGRGWDVEPEADDLPATLALSMPRPNPSRGALTLALDLPVESAVSFAIFDVQGREVWSTSTRLVAGRRTLAWDGVDRLGGRAGAGVYYARVHVGGESFTRRIVRL